MINFTTTYGTGLQANPVQATLFKAAPIIILKNWLCNKRSALLLHQLPMLCLN